MVPSKYVVDVSEANFEYEVIAYSKNEPVVVDFWAEWCGPCKTLGPILERLAEEANGSFRLAKVNVDENPTLATRYNVRGIPAVKAFMNGQVVAEFVGAQPEPNVREFLNQIAPSPSDLALAKGQSLLEMGEWDSAEEAFGQVLQEQPEKAPAVLGMAKALLAEGKGHQSYQLLKEFPASREYAAAEKLQTLAHAMARLESEVGDSDEILEAAYQRALSLVGMGNIPAALDGLMDILRQDKNYRDDEARMVILGLFEILGDNSDLTRQYRSEMASILF